MKRQVIAILLGLTVIALGWLTGLLISILALQFFSIEQWQANSRVLELVSLILPWLSAVAGGITTGTIVKQRGFWYGGLLGVTISLGLGAALLFASLNLDDVLPHDYPEEAKRYILSDAIYSTAIKAFALILLTGISGLIGEKLVRRKQHGKKDSAVPI